MSYFNPEIYNRDNLKTHDKSEVDFWEKIMQSACDSVECDYRFSAENGGLTDKLEYEFAGNVISQIREHMASSVLDVIVSKIDNYDDADFDDNGKLIKRD